MYEKEMNSVRYTVGGLEKCSFVDFPGRLCAVIFAKGCNLRCLYCHNPSLVKYGRTDPETAEELSLRNVLNFLEKRAGLLGGVCFSGGEPLCQPEGLEACILQVRKMGFSIKLDTNGTLPDHLEHLLCCKACPDYVALDFKDIPEGYRTLCGSDLGNRVPESLEILRKSKVPFEVRTTVCEPLHDLSRLRKIASYLQSGERWFLQCFHGGNILSPESNFSPPDRGTLEAFAVEMKRSTGLSCSVR